MKELLKHISDAGPILQDQLLLQLGAPIKSKSRRRYLTYICQLKKKGLIHSDEYRRLTVGKSTTLA